MKVNPELREKFIQADEKVWTARLAQYPGFAGKEVWIDPNRADEVVLVIRWADRESWKSIPVEQLNETEQQFAQQMGADTYQMIEAGEYQIRKFPQISTPN
jgi:uncharacterized protein (TIGR03792 family)